jgi:hypothetical protein
MLRLTEASQIRTLARIKKAKKTRDNSVGIYCLALRGEMKMRLKLNLLFIVMDLLTILVYPVVLLHGKLRQFSKSKEGVTPALVPVPVTTGS